MRNLGNDSFEEFNTKKRGSFQVLENKESLLPFDEI